MSLGERKKVRNLINKLALDENPENLPIKVLGEKIWEKQREILQSAINFRETLVVTGNGVGKTFIGGRLVVAFLLGFSPFYGYNGGTKVVIVGPKFEQLRKQIWSEVHAAYYKLNEIIPVGGKIQAHDLHLAPQWFAGIFAVDKENPEKIQGYHAQNFLAIIEEATGVPDEIEQAIKSCGTSPNSHFVAFCNPVRMSGWMYEKCNDPDNDELKEKGIRNVINVSCLDTPNYITGEETVPGLTSREWIEEKRMDWGEQSPLYQARVEGKWPSAASDALIPFEAVESACMEDRIKRLMHSDDSVVAMDIARGGEDHTVCLRLTGDLVKDIRIRDTPNSMKAALFFKECYHDWGGKDATPVIDENGLGGGPYDKARYELNIPARGFVSHRKPDEEYKERFANIKAQMAWELRKRFMEGTIGLMPNRHRDKLKTDLCGYRIEYDTKGKVVVVDPERSPDFGDSLIMAQWGQSKGLLKDGITSGGKSSTKKVDKEY